MKKTKQKKVKKQKAKVVPGSSHSMKMVKAKAILAGVIAVAAVLFVGFYFALVPLNIHAVGLWVLAVLASGAFAVFYNIVFTVGRTCGFDGVPTREEYEKWQNLSAKEMGKCGKLFWIPVLIAAAMVVAAITGAKIFHASSYASIIKVEDAVFEDDLSETLNTDSIALMDTQSAQMLGDREIGSLSHVVSQYNVSDDYTQIDYNGTPKKVSALDYAGFFKWKNNHKEGVPGYVIVDPVSMSASYQEGSGGMIYVPSAYLREDAARYIWKHFPTELFGNLHFEIDEDGNPYYVASVYEKTISLFGGETVKGAIILNPLDGQIQYYDLAEVPNWVDVVYEGDLICTQYNWYGELQNGFINSVFGKKGCKRVTTYYSSDEDEESEDEQPTSDYGYVAKDGDIWIYTGITSVNGDSSNIGFLMANERTGESHYYGIAGADEKSAMSAAEGEVQEKGYQASFPSLINVDGEPTYIMVLKDASGLVKLYAAVNVEQYNLVATATTQKDCIAKYRTLIGTSEATDGESSETENMPEAEEEPLEATGEGDVVIADIREIVVDGNTYLYLITDDQQIYRAKAAEHEEMLLLKAGDTVHISYNGKEIISCGGGNPAGDPAANFAP